MKVKNLTNYPQQLGDGHIIGATATTDERDYGLDKLTTRDRQRVKEGRLEVIEELPKETERQVSISDDAKSKVNGGKNNAN